MEGGGRKWRVVRTHRPDSPHAQQGVRCGTEFLTHKHEYKHAYVPVQRVAINKYKSLKKKKCKY